MIEIKVFPDPQINYDFENVYRPTDDTYLILDYFKYHVDFDYLDSIPLEKITHLLDMGTGTGYIALFFALLKGKIPKFTPKIYASDILPEAIDLAKRNEKLNNLSDEITFFQSDLFKEFPEQLQSSFDIVIFNPPYLQSIKGASTNNLSRSWDGGEKGYEIFLKFLEQAKLFLKKQPWSCIYYVCSSRTDLSTLYQLIQNKGYKQTILTKKHVFLEDMYLNKLELND